ncbi:hypothetical protein B9Z41_16240 [Limnohabitans sp. JirII-31]|nr:hypothetical protein B9Z41_16240 [Limnohabitans sp. JirII-31]
MSMSVDTPEQSEAAAPTETPPERIDVMDLRFSDPLRWLGLGFRDLLSQPLVTLFYGSCFWLMALIVSAVFRSNPEFTLSAISGCLLLGPFLAMGLYDVSMNRERGHRPTLGSSLTCWEPHVRSMGMLVMVVVVLELLWGRASLVVFAVFFNTGGMPTTASVIDAVFNPQNWEFVVAYLCVGGFFAGLVFATMAVSIPMILDRDTDAITAGITSLRVFLSQTGVMLWWGALITVLVLLALWPSAAGLLLVGPWLGFATWHAYRASVRFSPGA